MAQRAARVRQASYRPRVVALADEIELVFAGVAEGLRELWQRDIDEGRDYADAVAARERRESWAAQTVFGR
jgi:hypothetical protein